MGCPAGIGPEIVAAAVTAAAPEVRARLVVHGDRGPLERALAGKPWPREVPIVEHGFDATAGQPDETAGAAQVAYLESAIAAAQRGEVAALVTAPISKTWARRAGFAFPGHTELLAARFAAPRVAMAFVGPRFRVVLATIHTPLAGVPAELTIDGVAAVTHLFADALIGDLGVWRPRLGVVGLNPHAGEGGLIGTDERDVIAPAIEAVRASRRDLELGGPLVPDAAFRAALDGRWDGLVAMYHDQALITIKLIDFDLAVNVTLGLPIVRTSPDHGTAYDLAGSGKARADSFAAALALADQIVQRRAARA
ncbi:MAG: 4-hydroxythreonine-4-phosphate dehydrogenase PdxA [Deltaproteobacteria bacterium]|nr:4-hydroxythreonine-4-phosphate dehydrogenase PdxA [Deltaproteobacteria bacterium]